MWRKFEKIRWIEWIAALCVVIGIVFFVVYVWKLFASDYSVLERVGDSDIERTGQIGDFFGGIVGSVWALAGVLLYFSALKMQAKELHHQKEEMSENKKLLSQEQFETTFFNLLKAQDEIKKNAKGRFCVVQKDDSSYQHIITEYVSSDYFIRIRLEMKRLYDIYNKDKYEGWDKSNVEGALEHLHYFCLADNYYNPTSEQQEMEIYKVFLNINLQYLTSYYGIKEQTVKLAKSKATEKMMCQCVYGHLYIKEENILSHYCRHFYSIVKFLDQEKRNCLERINEKFPQKDSVRQAELDKLEIRFKGYVSFIDSALPTSELFLLFYNAILFPKAQELYVKYHLFDNLRIEDLLKKEHVKLMEGATLKTQNDIFNDIIKEIQQVV